MATRWWKKFDDTVFRFGSIHERDRHTDRQTDTVWRLRPRLMLAPRGRKMKILDCWPIAGLWQLKTDLHYVLFSYLGQAERTGGGIMLSTAMFIRLLPNMWTQYFENELIDSDDNWHTWSTEQGHETIDLGVRRSKVKVTLGPYSASETGIRKCDTHGGTNKIPRE